jgi:hypothetical protein
MTKRMCRIRQGDISHVKFNYKIVFIKTCIKKLSLFAIPLMILHTQSGLVAQRKEKIESTLRNGSATYYWELVFG